MQVHIKRIGSVDAHQARIRRKSRFCAVPPQPSFRHFASRGPHPCAVKVIACGAAKRRRRAAIPSGADARAGTRASAAPCCARLRVERLRQPEAGPPRRPHPHKAKRARSVRTWIFQPVSRRRAKPVKKPVHNAPHPEAPAACPPSPPALIAARMRASPSRRLRGQADATMRRRGAYRAGTPAASQTPAHVRRGDLAPSALRGTA